VFNRGREEIDKLPALYTVFVFRATNQVITILFRPPLHVLMSLWITHVIPIVCNVIQVLATSTIIDRVQDVRQYDRQRCLTLHL
jgi:hypothetical protein